MSNKINWKVRVKNKTFWISIIPMVLVLLHQILKLFGVDFDFTSISNQLVDIVETVFVILGLLGVVVDPTTKGIGDSRRALRYNSPDDNDSCN